MILATAGMGVSLLGLAGTGIAAFGNDSHRAGTLAISSGITAVGAALLTGGMVAAFHPHRPVSVQRIALEDGLLQENVPCRDVPNAAPHEPVTGRAVSGPALELPFGDTDAGGALEIDLAAALPPSLQREAAPGATMRVFVGALEVGTIRLDEVAVAVEARAWARAGAEICADAITDEACDPLERYLRERPAGAHVKEAREALERGRTGIPARTAAAAKARAEASREQGRRLAETLRQQGAAAAARRGAAEACRRICENACKRDAGCTGNCVARSCQ